MGLPSIWAKQLRRPCGLLGWATGRVLRFVNRVPNDWAISLLDIETNDQVLEVGFGPGYAIKKMSEMIATGSVSGIDLSETMLKQASALNAEAVASGRVDLRRCDIASRPYEEGVFDKVLVVNVIYFWPEAVAVLREIGRVMKPGGRLAIYFTSKDSLNRFRTMQLDVFAKV